MFLATKFITIQSRKKRIFYRFTKSRSNFLNSGNVIKTIYINSCDLLNFDRINLYIGDKYISTYSLDKDVELINIQKKYYYPLELFDTYAVTLSIPMYKFRVECINNDSATVTVDIYYFECYIENFDPYNVYIYKPTQSSINSIELFKHIFYEDIINLIKKFISPNNVTINDNKVYLDDDLI